MTLGIMRLSALGDVCNALGSVTVIRRHFPQARIVWFVGRVEYEFLKNCPNIEFEIVDKKSSFKEAQRIKKKYKNVKFDVLLHMQRSIRCSLLVRALKAERVIGFDRLRARELQWLFTNEQIQPPRSPHAVDAFMEFAYALGVPKHTKPEWDHGPLPQTTQAYITKNYGRFVGVIPSGSQPDRAWGAQNFSDVINHLHSTTDLNVVLLGGPQSFEQSEASKISEGVKDSSRLYNLVGKTSLEELKTTISECQFLITPDTGPAHIASSFYKTVLGLYVHMPKSITGPYNSLDTTIDRYPEALKKYYDQAPIKEDTGIPKRIKVDEAIQLISVDEVKMMSDKIVESLRG